MSASIEQAVLDSHCAFEPRGAGHKCQGSVSISCRGVEMSCPLCGPGEERAGPSPYTRAYSRARAIVTAAGIAWGSLSSDSQIAAVREAARERCPGCGVPAPEDPDKQSFWACECGWTRSYDGWRKS